MKPQLIHLPLERYQARYTADLFLWESAAFSKYFSVHSVTPNANTLASLQSGEVLDELARPRWALEQTAHVLRQVEPMGTRLYCSDFYHPGLDALAYSRRKDQFKIGAFCWAQTFDQYDFTRKRHVNWMRPWEVMAFEIYDFVFVACEGLRDLILSALPHVADKVFVVGLPYNSRSVAAQLTTFPSSREFDLVYAARWDEEKQPHYFLDVVERTSHKAVVCSGRTELTGDRSAIDRAYTLQRQGKLTILTNLTRVDYFRVLASSKVIFNSALQDWVSFTLLDAMTFGCKPLYPNFRSFPEALYWHDAFMYRPFDVDHACAQLAYLLQGTSDSEFAQLANSVLADHNQTLDKIAQIMLKG